MSQCDAGSLLSSVRNMLIHYRKLLFISGGDKSDRLTKMGMQSVLIVELAYIVAQLGFKISKSSIAPSSIKNLTLYYHFGKCHQNSYSK